MRSFGTLVGGGLLMTIAVNLSDTSMEKRVIFAMSAMLSVCVALVIGSYALEHWAKVKQSALQDRNLNL